MAESLNRERLRGSLEEWETLSALTNNLARPTKAQIDQIRHSIGRMSRAAVKTTTRRVEALIRERRSALGITPQFESVAKRLVEERDRAQRRGQVFLPAITIPFLMSRPEAAFPVIRDLPCHAWIGLDVHGMREDLTVDFYIPEAMLFEDMAALFNRSVELRQRIATEPRLRGRVLKELAAVRRGCVLAAYYLVEAYLNGLAFDFLATVSPTFAASHVANVEFDHVEFTKSRPSLTHKELDLLLESNCERGKSHEFVSFDKKCLHYPRIISGAKTPPLQVTNCAELQFLLGPAKDLRDSIVHQSPRYDETGTSPEKQVLFFSFADYEGEDLCPQLMDNVISLLRKIEALLGYPPGRMSWLMNREPDGLFPDRAFL